LHKWRHEVPGFGASKYWRSSAPRARCISSAHWGTAPRELPFERGEAIVKRSIRGFFIAQSLGEVAGNEHQKPE
jgi:hypothetical protein